MLTLYVPCSLPENLRFDLCHCLWPLKRAPNQPPPQALRCSRCRGERETRVTGVEPQGTMGRVKTPSRLPLRAHFNRERETSGWVRGRLPTVMSLFLSLFPTPETRRGMGTSFRSDGFWDRLGGRVLLFNMVNGCLGYHQPIITNPCPPKRSQESLHRKLVPIPLIVQERGISLPDDSNRQKKENDYH